MRSSLGILIAFLAISLGGITFLLFSPMPTSPEVTIRQTAIFLEKNPEWVKPEIKRKQARNLNSNANANLNVPENANDNENSKTKLYGRDLNHTDLNSMWDPKQEELTRNEVRVNPVVALSDLKQAMFSLNDNQLVERRNVIEVVRVLASIPISAGQNNGKNQEKPQDLLADEAERFLKPFRNQESEPGSEPRPPQENYEHGERALQYYVMSEKDPIRLKERLSKLGIPLIHSKKQIANPPGE